MSTSAIIFLVFLGLTKAFFFVGLIVWCLRNDQSEINPLDEGGGGGTGLSPYYPRPPGGSWRKKSLQESSELSRSR